MIRILLKAASPLSRAGLEQLLMAFPDLEILPEAAQKSARRREQEDMPPDVVIVELEGDDDESWAEAVDAYGAGTATVLLADGGTRALMGDAIRAGAKGVLPKQIASDELAAAVRAAAAGLIVFHADDVSALLPVRQPQAPGAPPGDQLTARENEVLAMIADGCSNKEIASRLTISEHTVKFHVASIMGKLGATSRTEAVTLAIRQGIILL